MDCGSLLPLWFASLLAKGQGDRRTAGVVEVAPVLELEDRGGLDSPAGWRSENGSRLQQSKAESAFSGRDQAFHGLAFFEEFGDGGVDLALAEGVDGDAVDDFPGAVGEGADRH